jgi:hypothetical protein
LRKSRRIKLSCDAARRKKICGRSEFSTHRPPLAPRSHSHLGNYLHETTTGVEVLLICCRRPTLPLSASGLVHSSAGVRDRTRDHLAWKASTSRVFSSRSHRGRYKGLPCLPSLCMMCLLCERDRRQYHGIQAGATSPKVICSRYCSRHRAKSESSTLPR